MYFSDSADEGCECWTQLVWIGLVCPALFLSFIYLFSRFIHKTKKRLRGCALEFIPESISLIVNFVNLFVRLLQVKDERLLCCIVLLDEIHEPVLVAYIVIHRNIVGCTEVTTAHK